MRFIIFYRGILYVQKNIYQHKQILSPTIVIYYVLYHPYIVRYKIHNKKILIYIW